MAYYAVPILRILIRPGSDVFTQNPAVFSARFCRIWVYMCLPIWYTTPLILRKFSIFRCYTKFNVSFTTNRRNKEADWRHDYIENTVMQCMVCYCCCFLVNPPHSNPFIAQFHGGLFLIKLTPFSQIILQEHTTWRIFTALSWIQQRSLILGL